MPNVSECQRMSVRNFSTPVHSSFTLTSISYDILISALLILEGNSRYT